MIHSVESTVRRCLLLQFVEICWFKQFEFQSSIPKELRQNSFQTDFNRMRNYQIKVNHKPFRVWVSSLNPLEVSLGLHRSSNWSPVGPSQAYISRRYGLVTNQWLGHTDCCDSQFATRRQSITLQHDWRVTNSRGSPSEGYRHWAELGRVLRKAKELWSFAGKLLRKKTRRPVSKFLSRFRSSDSQASSFHLARLLGENSRSSCEFLIAWSVCF